MALPTYVKDEAIALVTTYCATKVPSKHDEKIRVYGLQPSQRR